jgi:hypothetical protein
VRTALPDQELYESGAVEKTSARDGRPDHLDRSLGAPAPDKGLAPHERGLSHVEGRPANAEALPAVESGAETGLNPSTSPE